MSFAVWRAWNALGFSSERLCSKMIIPSKLREYRALKPGFHYRGSISLRTSTRVSKWKLGRHKHKHKHKKNGQVCACAYAYAYVVVLARENRVEISTRPWTNHRSLWPRPHAHTLKAIWRTLCPPPCLSSGWGELASRIESNMPLCARVCPYACAYGLVKTSLKSYIT